MLRLTQLTSTQWLTQAPHVNVATHCVELLTV